MAGLAPDEEEPTAFLNLVQEPPEDDEDTTVEQALRGADLQVGTLVGAAFAAARNLGMAR